MIVREDMVIRNHCGLHARVATGLAAIAQSNNVEIQLVSGGRSADCCSILEVLSLALTRDSHVEVLIRGKDADKSLDAVRELLTGTEFDG
ncbi:MAG: HPr family phosphocarrier protein [Desulfobulbus sp.]|nr:MAG: HPr family phosphocarrier protein [Desulfobulbus sp.]